MKRFPCLVLFTLLILSAETALPCTNLIITPGASGNGSAMLAYTNDGEWLYHLSARPAADHQPGDSVTFTNRYGVSGKIEQVPHTYGILGFHMNEHQVAIGETTFTGRLELWNRKKYLEYWHLMELALLRARTAREAIQVITALVETYGYGSEGESFSIIDPYEAWILEMTGTGDGGEGAVWVAVRIPDGMISAHANRARIGEFPLNDPENCVYSDNIISFAIASGYYNPETDGPFCFNEVYCPATPATLRYCETRVWSLFRRASPALKLSPDYHRGVEGASRYPLWIKPDKPLGLQDVFDLIRDHYEGTDFDLTTGIAAGAFGSPNRNRPLAWEIEGAQYAWERPISTINTAFSFVAQARSHLPADLGGVLWFGVDDTWYTCWFPVYCQNTGIAKPFATGDINRFSWDSAWWVFNFVSNYSNLRYSHMIEDIQKVQAGLESRMLARQDSVENALANLPHHERIAALTAYSAACGEHVHHKWKQLAEKLLTKYNDGYIKGDDGHIREEKYPDTFYRKVLQYDGADRYRTGTPENEARPDHQPY